MPRLTIAGLIVVLLTTLWMFLPDQQPTATPPQIAPLDSTMKDPVAFNPLKDDSEPAPAPHDEVNTTNSQSTTPRVLYGKQDLELTVNAGQDISVDEQVTVELSGSVTGGSPEQQTFQWLTADQYFFKTKGIKYNKRESLDFDIKIINSKKANARFIAPPVEDIRFVDIYLLVTDHHFKTWRSAQIMVTIRPKIEQNIAFYEIDMPDKNLLRCVEQYTADRHLTFVEELTALNCDNFKIKDLTGLEYFTNLEQISMINNAIVDIWPLRGLLKLRRLNLNNNRIFNLKPLTTLPYLAELRLMDNQISDLEPLQHLTQLTFLNLANNEIEKLDDLGRDFEVHELNLAGNAIDNTRPLQFFQTLKTLNLSKNPIRDLLFLYYLPRLESLDVSYCDKLNCRYIFQLKSRLKLIYKGRCGSL